MMFNCRICRQQISQAVFELRNLPAAAQNMPASEEELKLDRPVDLQIWCCPYCGVIQHSAVPVTYFREVLRASGVSDAMKKFRLEQFRSFLERNKLSGKKIIEAGCGGGEYLQIIREAGADAYGTEFNLQSVEKCKNNGLQVEKIFFETGNETLSNAPFDGFFILNFLEHIPDIPAFLAGLRKNLAAGAAGIIEVPNTDMLLEKSLPLLFSTEHIFYFTRETLITMLQNNGFIVRDCRYLWDNNIISAEVVTRTPPDFSGFTETAENLGDMIRNFIAAHRKVVFWGAGHETQALLSILGLTSETAAFVVDSSPDKQHHFTYVTHIPIVPPSHLDTTDADAIIVSCGGYASEVIKYIHSHYKDKFALAVLRENHLHIC